MDKFIILSPYSNRLIVKDQTGKEVEMQNAKNYPYFETVVQLLKLDGESVVQIGVTGERKIAGVDDFFLNIKFIEIEKLLHQAKFFIAVDNFLPHLANATGIQKGIVIFGPSDPLLFGYSQYENILKDRKYLRNDQWHKWVKCQFNADAFVEPEIVAQTAHKLSRSLLC